MLRGSRVHLRLLTEDDLVPFYSVISDVARHGPYYPQDLRSLVALQHAYRADGIWSEGFGRLLICENESGRTVGTIRYGQDHSYHNGLELGYLIFDEGDRGKGFATEAVRLLVQHLFATRTIHRIQISFFPENEASRLVAQKCGFIREGISRGAVFHHGRNIDIENWSILRDEVNYGL
jgi:[ribosomal protein S5]-alanine N-acetyltransferase